MAISSIDQFLIFCSHYSQLPGHAAKIGPPGRFAAGGLPLAEMVAVDK